jgi:ABC-type proline/glycine betaine transport system substrate-binding protein
MKITVERMSPALKCMRCFKHDYDKGLTKGWPDVCPACAKTLEQMGFTPERIEAGWYVDHKTGVAIEPKEKTK